MELDTATDRLARVVSTRADANAIVSELTEALRACHELRAFLSAAEADLTARLAAGVSFPEATIADISRQSQRSASATLERSATLGALPNLASALDEAEVTAEHIDVITRETKGLEAGCRRDVHRRLDELADVASAATVEQFRRRVRTEVERARSDDGMERLERQRRATRLTTWTDPEGMWNLRGRFDPVTALSLSSALDRAVSTLFAEEAPATCPADPIEKQHHLRALALASLVDGGGRPGTRPGRPEFVAVIDISAPPDTARPIPTHPAAVPCIPHGRHEAGDQSRPAPDRRRSPRPLGDPAVHPPRSDRWSASGPSPTEVPTTCGPPRVTFPIPIEVPVPVLAEMIEDADVTTVLVRDGVVLHAPGALDLGRSTRLASRAQRRALRALYATCAIPGCTVPIDRCKAHHVTWWRHGGATDLSNLLPVCTQHHVKIHDAGWQVQLDDRRRLTVRFPDGTVRTGDPPSRSER